METESILQILVLAIGFYMAWNIGANDVSNAMGTSVGSGALTLRRAVILAAIFEFCGAYFVGANVSETMQKGLIDTTLFLTDPTTLIMGMCGALLGTGIWLQIASFFGWPVSTTHAIVGAIIGFGLIAVGVDAILWGEVMSIVFSWILTPVISAFIAYSIFFILQKNILYALNPTEAAIKMMPYLVFVVFTVFTASFMFNGLENLHLAFSSLQVIGLSLLVGFIGAAITFFIMKKVSLKQSLVATLPAKGATQNVVSVGKAMKHLQRIVISSKDETHARASNLLKEVKALSLELRKETDIGERTSHYAIVERLFIYLQILSACYVAFAHGANDVANAIGPVAAVLEIIKKGVIPATASVPSWLLALGGLGIIIGLATWGWRVIETVGRKITELTPTRGFCAEFGAATTILIASKLGFPISTTHCLVGAVLGVGAARGIRAINLSMVRDIILSWIVTIPASAVMSILMYYLLRAIFI